MFFNDLWVCALLAGGCTAASFLVHMRDAIGPDEGYLWYGTLRVFEGKVPLRDFRSYEPGRYYWCAAWMLAFGRGILALRLAVHLFYWMALVAGLLALRLGGVDWPGTFATALILTAWAYPQHKLFEPGLSMMAVLAGAVLLLSPGPGTFMLAGAVAGLTAFIGINYGLYAGAALFFLTLLAALKVQAIPVLHALGAFSGGFALGIMPLILMLVLIPGFAGTFFERRVRAVVKRGSTNLPLPMPWPWRPVPRAISGLPAFGRQCTRWLFLLVPVFCWSVAIGAWFVPWSTAQAIPAAVAAGFVGTFNVHHAMSRADLPHLAQSMAPLILGLSGILAGVPLAGIFIFVLFGLAGAVSVLQMYPLVHRIRAPHAYDAVKIGRNRICVPQSSAQAITQVRDAVATYLRPGESILAVPTLSALYPILGLHAPVYDIFCVYPASEIEQERMLRSIESSRVRLAAVDNGGLDGREDLRFSNTHPRVWAYLRDKFEPVEPAESGSQLHILHRKAVPSVTTSWNS